METPIKTLSSYDHKKRTIAILSIILLAGIGAGIWYFINKKIEEQKVMPPISPAEKLQMLTEESAKTTIDPKKDIVELTQLQKKSVPVKINPSRQEKIFEMLNNRK